MSTFESTKTKIPGAFHIKNAIKLVWKSSAGLTIASISLVIVQSIFPLLSIYLMKLIVDAVTEGMTVPNKEEAFIKVAVLICLG